MSDCVDEFNVPLDTVSLRGRVFPANHLAMVLTKQTYNTHDEHKKPKLTQTNSGLIAFYDIQPGNRPHKTQLPEPARACTYGKSIGMT